MINIHKKTIDAVQMHHIRPLPADTGKQPRGVAFATTVRHPGHTSAQIVHLAVPLSAYLMRMRLIAHRAAAVIHHRFIPSGKQFPLYVLHYPTGTSAGIHTIDLQHLHTDTSSGDSASNTARTACVTAVAS